LKLSFQRRRTKRIERPGRLWERNKKLLHANSYDVNALEEDLATTFYSKTLCKTLDLIAERMKRDFPRIEVCGTYSPPFKAEFSKAENEAMINAVNSAGADVLWVGMTSSQTGKMDLCKS
jgi:hypothetical protein